MLRDHQQASHNTTNIMFYPITGSDTYLCLFDRFHERNTSSEIDVLRRITSVPELNGLVNKQVEEQLHLWFESSKHFLNKMQPVNHIYLLRSIINHYNTIDPFLLKSRGMKYCPSGKNPDLLMLVAVLNCSFIMTYIMLTTFISYFTLLVLWLSGKTE